jgi:hypothetical protein
MKKKIFFENDEWGIKNPYFHTDFKYVNLILVKEYLKKVLAKNPKYTECQAFYPVVRIGPLIPSPARECWVQGGRQLACGEGGGGYADDGTDNLVL